MWKRIVRLLITLRTSEKGEAYVEYVVLASLAVLVILTAVQYFFGGLAVLFQRMGDAVRGIG